jgi:hypothetical protein
LALGRLRLRRPGLAGHPSRPPDGSAPSALPPARQKPLLGNKTGATAARATISSAGSRVKRSLTMFLKTRRKPGKSRRLVGLADPVYDNRMIRPLALLHRRLRRLYYGLLAVTAATMLIHVALGALGIGFRRNKQMPMDLTMDLTMAARFAVGGLTVLVLLAIVVVYLLKGWHNERATELLVLSDAKGPKFVAPSSMTRFALSPFFIAGVLALESSMAFATASSRGREFVSGFSWRFSC